MGGSGLGLSIVRKLARQKHTLISVLLDRVLRSPLADLAAYVKGTDAAAFISAEGERTSAGVQAERLQLAGNRGAVRAGTVQAALARLRQAAA